MNLPKTPDGMQRALLVMDGDSDDELNAGHDWLDKFRSRLHYVSPDAGCDSIQMFWVIGPPDVIETIPASVRSAFSEE